MKTDLLTEKIIGCAMKIHRSMGPGFLETVYHRCMEIELADAGISFESEKRLNVSYQNHVVGHYVADFYLENGLIIELKAIESLLVTHEVQIVNYLSATGVDIGLLLNFGSKSLQIKRKFRLHTPSNINPTIKE